MSTTEDEVLASSERLIAKASAAAIEASETGGDELRLEDLRSALEAAASDLDAIEVRDTEISASVIHKLTGTAPMSDQEFAEAFGDLPIDGEG